MYLQYISLVLQLLLQVLSGLKGAQAPAEVIAAVQAAIDSIVAHQNDIISKSNLDAMRG